MSHFMTIVAVPYDDICGKIRNNTEAERAVDRYLAPYMEDPDDPAYLEFDDHDDEVREGYEHVSDGRTMDEYAEDEGYIKHDGKYGYMMNPNAKWDWWVVGGRWRTKLWVEGRPADYGKIVDIQWDMIRDTVLTNAQRSYNIMKEAYENGTKPKDWFCNYVEGEGISTGFGHEMLYIAGESLDEYVHRHGYDVECPLDPYAFIDMDGKWHEKGHMGWFGISTDECPQDEWYKEFESFVSSLGPEDYLVVVDCHI